MPDTFKLVYQTFNSWTKLLCVIVEERNIQKSVIILQPNGKNRHKFNIFWWLASYFCNNNLFEVAYFGALFTDCEYRNSFISILWQVLCSCNASTWSEQREIWRRFFVFSSYLLPVYLALLQYKNEIWKFFQDLLTNLQEMFLTKNTP